MIPHIFSKTKPVNFILLSLLLLVYLIFYEGFVGLESFENKGFLSYFSKNVAFILKVAGVLVPSLFLMDFVLKRNKITLTHSYQLFYFTVLCGLFSAVFTEVSLLMAHFFVLLGFRRLLSLRSKQRTERKIFEASLWFLVASFFYDWTLLYFLALLLSLLFFDKYNFRYLGIILWSLVVYTALVFAFIVGADSSEFFNSHYVFSLPEQSLIEKFTLEILILVSFSVLLLLWITTKIRQVKSASIGRKSAVRLILLCAILGFVLYLLYPVNSYAPLLFVFFPLSFLLGQATVEFPKRWHKELALWGFLSLPLWGLLAYLVVN